MKTAVCAATARGDRINLVIRKGEKGYAAFSKVLSLIEKGGCMSWYGDVTRADGREQCGLIVTVTPNRELSCRPTEKETK